MTDIERRIRIEQEWVRRNVMADHQNGERYEAYNGRRGLRDLDWELGDLKWSVPYWKEPAREINFELDWESLSASSDRAPKQHSIIAWVRPKALPAVWLSILELSRRVMHFIIQEL
jgi:hypothetical protein